jgi:hypothetical protein
MKQLLKCPVLVISIFLSCVFLSCSVDEDNVIIKVSFNSTLSDTAFDGRLLLLLSTNNDDEPRFQISDGPGTQLVFGMDVESFGPSDEFVFDRSSFGYPIEKLDDIPSGDYFVQVLLHKYETFRRADGYTVKLPMDRGEGQQWNKAPGNIYSTPFKVHIDPVKNTTINIIMDQEIPPIDPPADTKYVKHVRIQSTLLSEFWGRPMFLGAHVLLPEGFEEHPGARYPLAIMHGHFPSDFRGWRTDPPDPDLEPDYSDRFRLKGYNRIMQQEAYDFYKTWTGPDFPRVLAIEIQHANPFYDDSYAVNSANLGP